MRVLSVGNMHPPHHMGGYELMWRSSVRHTRDAGHRVRVLTTDYRSGQATSPDDPEVHRELRWYWRDHAFPRLGLRERRALERHNAGVLQRHLTDLRPDAIEWWAMGGMSLSLIEQARRAGVPSAGVVVDDWLVYGPDVDAWLRTLSRLGPLGSIVGRASGIPAHVDFVAVEAWVFVSETVRRRAVAARGELRNTVVAGGGIERALFPEGPEKPWEGRLLYLGRIDPRKGIDTGIRALALLPGASLTVIGGGDERHLRELRELAAELDLDGRVVFTRRRRDEVAAAYAEADCLLFPVRWEEPWGLVPLEAMAVGTPVVATATGGSGEYLSHEENCLVFQPRDDPRALADAVARLATDEPLRRRLRAGGRATVDRFDERSFNEAVLEAVESAAGR